MSNDDKSVWEPCQEILWLVIIWHSDSGNIEISERRVGKIVSTVCSIMDGGFCYFCSMPSLLYRPDNFYWSCGGGCESYYDATLFYLFYVYAILGRPTRAGSIHEGCSHFLEGQY